MFYSNLYNQFSYPTRQNRIRFGIQHTRSHLMQQGELKTVDVFQIEPGDINRAFQIIIDKKSASPHDQADENNFGFREYDLSTLGSVVATAVKTKDPDIIINPNTRNGREGLLVSNIFYTNQFWKVYALPSPHNYYLDSSYHIQTCNKNTINDIKPGETGVYTNGNHFVVVDATRLPVQRSVEEKARILGEVTDVIFQYIQLSMLANGLFKISEEDSPEHKGCKQIILVNEEKINQYLNRLFGKEHYTAAKKLFDIVVEKFRRRQEWEKDNMTALEYYSIRVGDELRELFNEIYPVSLPKDQDVAGEAEGISLQCIPEQYRWPGFSNLYRIPDQTLPKPSFAENPVIFNKLLLAKKTVKENRHYLKHFVTEQAPQTLQPAFLYELDHMFNFACQIAKTELGSDYTFPEAFLELAYQKIAQRLENNPLNRSKAVDAHIEALLPPQVSIPQPALDELLKQQVKCLA